MNPAVATSLRIANWLWEGDFQKPNVEMHDEASWVLIYWGGPIVGALLGVCAHYIIEASTSKEFVPYALLHNSQLNKE